MTTTFAADGATLISNDRLYAWPTSSQTTVVGWTDPIRVIGAAPGGAEADDSPDPGVPHPTPGRPVHDGVHEAGPLGWQLALENDPNQAPADDRLGWAG
jgi:hypothetical protein